MASSPTRPSLLNTDTGTSLTEKKIDVEDPCLMRQHKVCKDEGSIKREKDNFTEDLSKKKDTKRKRSRSPLQEPSSSKNCIERRENRHQIRSSSHFYVNSDGHSEYRHQKSETNRRESPRRCYVDKDEIGEAPNATSDKYRKSFRSRSKSPASNNWNERYTKSLPPGAKERREEMEKQRQEQLRKDYANLSYGGKVVAGDGSATTDYTIIKEDCDKSKTELTEADSTSNADDENMSKEDLAQEINEIPLEDILQGKNPILYCTLGAKFRDMQLEFDQIKEEGPQHDRIFTWKMKIGNLETVGTGNSKKSAKNDAAEKMVRLLYKAPRPIRKPMWGPYGPPSAMFPPGMNVPGPHGMFPPFLRGLRPHPGMIGPPMPMFGPRPGILGPSGSFGGSFGPFGRGFPGPRPPFNGHMPFTTSMPENLVPTPEELEFGAMINPENSEDNDLGPPGEAQPTSTMDSLFEVKAGSSTMDSLYQPEEGNTTNSCVIPTPVVSNIPPQFDRYAGANNPISKLYDMAKKEKISEPLFETINEKVLSERKSQKGFTMKKTEYTIQCDFKGKKYEGKALTKKDAKLAAATLCWAEVGGGLPPGPASLQASISTLLQNQRQVASETKPPVKTPNESRPGDWQCSNEECGNINFAWRTECNNCNTRKPRNPESKERELSNDRDKSRTNSRSDSREHGREKHRKSHERTSERNTAGSSHDYRYNKRDHRLDHRDNREEQSRSTKYHDTARYSRDSSGHSRDHYRHESSREDSYRELGERHKRHRSEKTNQGPQPKNSYRDDEHFERLDRGQYECGRSEYPRHERDRSHQTYSHDHIRTVGNHSQSDRYESRGRNRDSYDTGRNPYRERYVEQGHFEYEKRPEKSHRDKDRDRYR